jgi:hypothetical protein
MKKCVFRARAEGKKKKKRDVFEIITDHSLMVFSK